MIKFAILILAVCTQAFSQETQRRIGMNEFFSLAITAMDQDSFYNVPGNYISTNEFQGTTSYQDKVCQVTLKIHRTIVSEDVHDKVKMTSSVSSADCPELNKQGYSVGEVELNPNARITAIMIIKISFDLLSLYLDVISSVIDLGQGDYNLMYIDQNGEEKVLYTCNLNNHLLNFCSPGTGFPKIVSFDPESGNMTSESVSVSAKK